MVVLLDNIAMLRHRSISLWGNKEQNNKFIWYIWTLLSHSC